MRLTSVSDHTSSLWTTPVTVSHHSEAALTVTRGCHFIFGDVKHFVNCTRKCLLSSVISHRTRLILLLTPCNSPDISVKANLSLSHFVVLKFASSFQKFFYVFLRFSLICPFPSECSLDYKGLSESVNLGKNSTKKFSNINLKETITSLNLNTAFHDNVVSKPASIFGRPHDMGLLTISSPALWHPVSDTLLAANLYLSMFLLLWIP